MKLEQSPGWKEVLERQRDWWSHLSSHVASGTELSAWRCSRKTGASAVGQSKIEHVRLVSTHSALGMFFLTPSDFKKRVKKNEDVPLQGHKGVSKEWIFSNRIDCLFAARIRAERKIQDIYDQNEKWERTIERLWGLSKRDYWTSRLISGAAADLARALMKAPMSLQEMKKLGVLEYSSVRRTVALWKKAGLVGKEEDGTYYNVSLSEAKLSQPK